MPGYTCLAICDSSYDCVSKTSIISLWDSYNEKHDTSSVVVSNTQPIRLSCVSLGLGTHYPCLRAVNTGAILDTLVSDIAIFLLKRDVKLQLTFGYPCSRTVLVTRAISGALPVENNYDVIIHSGPSRRPVFTVRSVMHRPSATHSPA